MNCADRGDGQGLLVRSLVWPSKLQIPSRFSLGSDTVRLSPDHPHLFEVEAALAGLAVNVLVVDLRDGCCGWSLVEMLDKLLDLVVAALGFSRDLYSVSDNIAMACLQTYRAIRSVSHETSDTNALGLLLGEGPEVDTLDLALDLV